MDLKISNLIPRTHNKLNEEVSPERGNGHLSIQLPAYSTHAIIENFLLSNGHDANALMRAPHTFDLPSEVKPLPYINKLIIPVLKIPHVDIMT